MNATAVGRAKAAARPIAMVSAALWLVFGLYAVSIRGAESRAAAELGVVVHPGSVRAIPLGVYDEVDGSNCALSADGLLWYAKEPGLGVPVESSFASCTDVATLRSVADPPIPAWAKPRAGHATQALFVAASLQEAYSRDGMIALHGVAASERIPMTWMVADWTWVNGAHDLYQRYHEANGDDVQTVLGVAAREHQILSWLTPNVAVLGAGRERSIDQTIARNYLGFWGIAWNSNGTDGNADIGAPWGAYCADPASYKHPAPAGSCRLVGFEWTARDLTRAYLSEQEAAFSTDPDDLRLRGGFSVEGAKRYVAALTDAYAAAGESQPLVMMAQQESVEEENDDRTGDRAILQALYRRVRIDGLRAMTLSGAVTAAHAFAGGPRAIAFPFISGGRTFQTLGSDVSPATIDFHDAKIGLTFVAGRTLPVRAFAYNRNDPSKYDVGVSSLNPARFPTLTGVSRTDGGLGFHFHSAAPAHFAVALWSDPDAIGLAPQPNVVRAGRGGAVIVVDLPAGDSTAQVRCSRCDPRHLPLAR